VELRSAYPGGVAGAERRVRELVGQVTAGQAEVWMAGTYLTTELTAAQVRELVQLDADADETGDAQSTEADVPTPARRAAIHRLWPNFETGALIYRTIVTTKCQAVHRAFDGL